jgi:hypothetical protein
MSHRPERIYTAEHIADGVRHVAKLRAMQLSGEMTEPLIPHHAQITAAPPAAQQGQEPQPEIAEGHCLTCKGKKSFTVEKTETMKNGAVRKSGKCLEPGCNTTVSTFTKGEGAAA